LFIFKNNKDRPLDCFIFALNPEINARNRKLSGQNFNNHLYMKVAVVGATGMVGNVMLKVLAERDFPVTELIPVASEKSVGKSIEFKGKWYTIHSMEQAIAAKPAIALFSAGGGTSLEWAPKFAAAGIKVIDNSSAWRMDPSKKLVVPEINGTSLEATDYIIANPNCSTIQMVMVLMPLYQKYGMKRVVVSTYQSVTGTGVKAVTQMENERNNREGEMAYAYPIDRNAIPQIDVFLDNGYTKEEMKMVLETKKIMGDPSIAVTATCVRIPVMGGHSESVNIRLEQDFDLEDVRNLLAQTPGVVVQDNPASAIYPMPLWAHDKDEVFVGRIRRDETEPNTLNLWIVADNLRKGAATNAVQIAEYLVAHKMI
jgi:aspartate-semialdehyde dehydrogenase